MRKPTLLCIDDDHQVLVLRRLVLESAGYRVLSATGGPEGLRLFQSEPVDAVILDYLMPGMDGSQVLRRMRQLRPRVPVVLLSAYVSSNDDAAAGFDACLIKGQSPALLLAELKRLLGARQSESKEDSGWFDAAA